MRLEDKQEQLSLAVLHATCAKAGFGFKITGRIQDNWGWVHCTPEQLVLRRCLRWMSLRGAEETGQGTITVYLPESHVLTPDALRKLARTRSLEQWIEYNPEGAPHVDHA
ncbi:MAG: hypothetical protein HY000_12330 [Planctomycetes bacterium]|nr:hypothetical protein [Planctomycetota bacterium]